MFIVVPMLVVKQFKGSAKERKRRKRAAQYHHTAFQSTRERPSKSKRGFIPAGFISESLSGSRRFGTTASSSSSSSSSSGGDVTDKYGNNDDDGSAVDDDDDDDDDDDSEEVDFMNKASNSLDVSDFWLETESVSIFVIDEERTVLTVQEKAGDCWGKLRKQLMHSYSRIRREDHNFLLCKWIVVIFAHACDTCTARNHIS